MPQVKCSGKRRALNADGTRFCRQQQHCAPTESPHPIKSSAFRKSSVVDARPADVSAECQTLADLGRPDVPHILRRLVPRSVNHLTLINVIPRLIAIISVRKGKS